MMKRIFGRSAALALAARTARARRSAARFMHAQNAGRARQVQAGDVTSVAVPVSSGASSRTPRPNPHRKSRSPDELSTLPEPNAQRSRFPLADSRRFAVRRNGYAPDPDIDGNYFPRR